MRSWLPILLAVTGAGCATTTTVASAPDQGEQRWFVETARPETVVEGADGGEQPIVVVEATSPTSVRYRTEGETVVPIKRAYPAAARIRRRNKVLGMLIGGGLGAAVAGGLGSESGRRQGEDCGELCGTGPLVFSVVGMLAGGVAGSFIGRSF